MSGGWWRRTLKPCTEPRTVPDTVAARTVDVRRLVAGALAEVRGRAPPAYGAAHCAVGLAVGDVAGAVVVGDAAVGEEAELGGRGGGEDGE